MDLHTLVVANVLLFALYACLMAVSAQVHGDTKGTAWFGLSNLVRCLGMLALAIPMVLPAALGMVLATVLMTAGMVLLHRSFAELLERGQMLWRLQTMLLAFAVGASLYLMVFPSHYPVAMLIASAVLGVQAALTASVVFSFSGEGVQAAGWFTGLVLSLYALVHLLRVAVTLRYNTPEYSAAAETVERVWLLGAMLANGAITFGFLFISAAKLRLELLWRAQIDELTGLLNRWALKRVAVQEVFRCLRKKGCLSAVMMDLDGMKQVNDRLGHGCGDAVLQAVSGVLQQGVRDRDSVARMGGDEFCVLLPDTDVDEAMVVAERLRAAIDATSVRFGNETVRVRASFGVSSSSRSGLNWQALVHHGDQALYRAKRDGRNRVVAAEPLEAAAVAWPEGAATVAERRRRQEAVGERREE